MSRFMIFGFVFWFHLSFNSSRTSVHQGSFKKTVMFQFIVLSLVALCMIHGASGTVFCNISLVQQALRRCEKAYEFEGDGIELICKIYTDCFMQCGIDALGDCKNSGELVNQFEKYDYKKYQVYYRILCTDLGLARTLNGCSEYQTCHSSHFASNSSFLDLYNTGQYDEYKKQLCSSFAKNRSCISVRQTENCSAASARLSEDIIKIGKSASFCENTDIKHLYMQYGGDDKCDNPKVDSKCFPSKVRSEVFKCSKLVVQSMNSSNISKFCQSLECNLKCSEKAVGQCYTNAENLLLDPAASKVSARAICERKDEFIAALRECKLNNALCYTEYSTTLAMADDLIVQENYEAYRQTVCSGASKFRACMKYVASGKCTTEMVSLLNNITDVSYSYAGCGQQNHAYFFTYNYDTKCDTSGSGKPVTSMLHTDIIMLMIVLLYQ